MITKSLTRNSRAILEQSIKVEPLLKAPAPGGLSGLSVGTGGIIPPVGSVNHRPETFEVDQKDRCLKIVILGLSITSSWGNGHATTYRGLVRELAARGHRVLFLERDVEWYANNRDLSKPPYCRVALYSTLKELKERFTTAVRNADLVMVGSYVQEGVAIGEWVTRIGQGVTSFYDIDTPVTFSRLATGTLDYLCASLIPKYNIYFSFTGGPILEFIRKRYGAPKAEALYCSVDDKIYFPEAQPPRWDLGYMGTYSEDRQSPLNELLIQPAREWNDGRFLVAGPQYPRSLRWPSNVKRRNHLPPAKHRAFYNSQRFTLNITRANMIQAGYSPSVRLFEAAACGTPIISDCWEGLDHFFRPGKEIFTARSCKEVLAYLREIPETERKTIGARARERVLANHTASYRALHLENCVRACLGKLSVS